MDQNHPRCIPCSRCMQQLAAVFLYSLLPSVHKLPSCRSDCSSQEPAGQQGEAAPTSHIPSLLSPTFQLYHFAIIMEHYGVMMECKVESPLRSTPADNLNMSINRHNFWQLYILSRTRPGMTGWLRIINSLKKNFDIYCSRRACPSSRWTWNSRVFGVSIRTISSHCVYHSPQIPKFGLAFFGFDF